MNLLTIQPYLSKKEFADIITTTLPYATHYHETWETKKMCLDVAHNQLWVMAYGFAGQEVYSIYHIDLPSRWKTGMHDHKWCLLYLRQFSKKSLKALRKTYAMYLEQQNARSSHEGLEAALADVPPIEDDLTDIPY